MPQKIRLWQISSNNHLIELQPTEPNFETTLEDWLESDISIISDDLLVIGRQVSTDFGGYIDLLALNSRGDVAIIELKRSKTPREVVAQALDYASWVNDLSRDDILNIANKYLGERGPLERAFRSRFGSELPDVMNDTHQIIVVASSIDPSSERIIKYLSDIHGLNINAVTFQCFADRSNLQLLGRVFLIEPSEVEMNVIAKSSSKRKPNLTYEQLEQIADQNGVGTLYRQLVEAFRPLFYTTQTTRSNIQFVLKWDNERGTALNLIPEESNQQDGVRFQLYSIRLARIHAVRLEDIQKTLPPNSEPWKYYATAPPEYSGHTGFFKNFSDAEPLLKLLSTIRTNEANGR